MRSHIQLHSETKTQIYEILLFHVNLPIIILLNDNIYLIIS